MYAGLSLPHLKQNRNAKDFEVNVLCSSYSMGLRHFRNRRGIA
jgi:hypothetical protein